LALVGGVTPVIITWSEDGVQGGLEIVHSKTFAPTPKFVIPDVSEFGFVIVPEPLTSVHVPVPTVAVLPANVAVVPHTDWSVPAAATVGVEVIVIETWSEDEGHGELVIVH